MAKRMSRHAVTGIGLFGYALLAAYLLKYSLISAGFNEERFITDHIWLDSWAMMFFAIVVVIWRSGFSWRSKGLLILAALSVYGVVEIALMYAGTPYGLNAYWGDMQFRIAMILKFIGFLKPGDFYYKALPAFYPPLYYFLLSVYARLFTIEAYKMLKIGSMLIYAFGPFLLYFFWRKLVSPFQAFLVTLSTFLICSFSGSSIQSVPHAFLANSFFIPWWLFFVERIGHSRKSWRFYLEGGIIGAAIFSTY